jgi:hypothetical protein
VHAPREDTWLCPDRRVRGSGQGTADQSVYRKQCLALRPEVLPVTAGGHSGPPQPAVQPGAVRTCRGNAGDRNAGWPVGGDVDDVARFGAEQVHGGHRELGLAWIRLIHLIANGGISRLRSVPRGRRIAEHAVQLACCPQRHPGDRGGIGTGAASQAPQDLCDYLGSERPGGDSAAAPDAPQQRQLPACSFNVTRQPVRVFWIQLGAGLCQLTDTRDAVGTGRVDELVPPGRCAGGSGPPRPAADRYAGPGTG